MSNSTSRSFIFSAEVHHLLVEAGWHQSRTVELSHCQVPVSTVAGWPPVVQAFLKEFGCLMLYFIRRDDSIAYLHFDVARAHQNAATGYSLADYAFRAGELALYIIGQAYTENLLLLMSASGQVYGGYEDCLYAIAGNGETAIEAICLDLPFREIP